MSFEGLSDSLRILPWENFLATSFRNDWLEIETIIHFGQLECCTKQFLIKLNSVLPKSKSMLACTHVQFDWSRHATLSPQMQKALIACISHQTHN